MPGGGATGGPQGLVTDPHGAATRRRRRVLQRPMAMERGAWDEETRPLAGISEWPSVRGGDQRRKLDRAALRVVAIEVGLSFRLSRRPGQLTIPQGK